MHFSVSSESLTSLYHHDDVLVTQEKGGTIQSWLLSNSGYTLGIKKEMKHTGFCRIEFVPDENFLICPKDENTLAVYDLDDFVSDHLTLSPDSSSTTPLGQVMCFKHIKFSGQSYILAGYESGDFLTWDLRCSKVVDSKKFEECPMSVDYDTITNRGIYGGPSDRLGVFSYKRAATEVIKKSEIALKNPGINCINIRKDQKVFSTAGWDGRIRIYSWKSLRPLAVLTEHKAAVTDICYSDDKVSLWKAPLMAAAGLDGQISLWDLYN